MWVDHNIHGFVYKVSVILDKILCHILKLVLVVFILIDFAYQKHSFLVSFFVSALQFNGLFILLCVIQFLLCKQYVSCLCASSNVYLSTNFYVLDEFLVRLDMLNLAQFENLPIFGYFQSSKLNYTVVGVWM